MLPRDIWPKIKVVFFDAEGTLFLMRPSVGHIYINVCQKYGLKADPQALGESFGRAFFQHMKRRKEGKVPLTPEGCKEEWRRIFFEAIAPFGELEDPEATFRECYDAFAQPEAFALAPGIPQVLECLRASGRRLGIISNWDERLIRLLEAYKLSSFFEDILVSCLVGLAKPQKEIYTEACRRFGVAPEEALMVGDSLEDDVLAAREAGLWALHYPGGDLRRLFPRD